MKKFMIGVTIRFIILYLIVFGLFFFFDVALNYSTFIIGILLAFLTFSGNGMASFSNKSAGLEYGADINPEEKTIPISPMFIASLLLFLSGFLFLLF